MKKRLTIAAVSLCLMVAAITIVLSRSGDGLGLRAKARKDWKEGAIAEISRRSYDTNWLASELKLLKTYMAKPESEEGDWLSDQLILMNDGEWMIYANKCRKEDARIHDIFVSRGSNGKWYYSTYHFCIGMLDAKFNEQSESLSAFIKQYFLVEFDGRSDECLRVTWPPKRK